MDAYFTVTQYDFDWTLSTYDHLKITAKKSILAVNLRVDYGGTQNFIFGGWVTTHVKLKNKKANETLRNCKILKKIGTDNL